VADALFPIEEGIVDRPDEIYLLSVLTSLWFVTRLRIGDSTLYDMPVDDRYWETHPDSLVSITGKSEAPGRVAIP
jgi:hypothetical protein